MTFEAHFTDILGFHSLTLNLLGTMKERNEVSQLDISKFFKEIEKIVNKAYHTYYVSLWDKSDWEQEAKIVLLKLLRNNEDLYYDKQKLLTYFKVMFSNHIRDQIRKQESKKRKFNKYFYSEVSEIEYKLANNEIEMDDFILLHLALEDFKKKLSPEERLNYEKLIANVSFKGRKKLIERLQKHLKDFDPKIPKKK